MEKIAASIAQIAAEALFKAGADTRPMILDLPDPLLDELKAWIGAQPEPRPTLPEAVHRGLTEWLSAQGYPPAASGTSAPR